MYDVHVLGQLDILGDPHVPGLLVRQQAGFNQSIAEMEFIIPIGVASTLVDQVGITLRHLWAM